MKKIFTLLSILPLASAAFGQITILATDMPVPTGSYNIMDMTNPMATSPIVGTNITWDYGLTNGTPYTEDYATETDAFFTGAGVDVNYATGKGMAPGFYYNVFSELDFTTAKVAETGIMIPYQAYDLSIATGNTGDSMEIPLQKHLHTTPVDIIHFPFTNGSSWHSVSRSATDFTLTVTPFYDHSPSQHVYYIHRDDTVVGWGKMRVYATSGPSVYYDVLMDKISEYAVDSFYISGAPASPLVLSSFGIAQGQHSDSSFYYNFYRKGSFNYLADFDYGVDPTYTALDMGYVSTDNIAPSGVGSLAGVAYSTVLFPNPAKNEINLKVIGADLKMAAYLITDITGKTIMAGRANAGSTLHIDLNASMPAGTYILTVINEKNESVIKESFAIN